MTASERIREARSSRGATIRRAEVTVNGKPVGEPDRDTLVVVVPTGYSSQPLRAALVELGYLIGSEWIDGTGTLTMLAKMESP